MLKYCLPQRLGQIEFTPVDQGDEVGVPEQGRGLGHARSDIGPGIGRAGHIGGQKHFAVGKLQGGRLAGRGKAVQPARHVPEHRVDRRVAQHADAGDIQAQRACRARQVGQVAAELPALYGQGHRAAFAAVLGQIAAKIGDGREVLGRGGGGCRAADWPGDGVDEPVKADGHALALSAPDGRMQRAQSRAAAASSATT